MLLFIQTQFHTWDNHHFGHGIVWTTHNEAWIYTHSPGGHDLHLIWAVVPTSSRSPACLPLVGSRWPCRFSQPGHAWPGTLVAGGGSQGGREECSPTDAVHVSGKHEKNRSKFIDYGTGYIRQEKQMMKIYKRRLSDIVKALFKCYCSQSEGFWGKEFRERSYRKDWHTRGVTKIWCM